MSGSHFWPPHTHTHTSALCLARFVLQRRIICGPAAACGDSLRFCQKRQREMWPDFFSVGHLMTRHLSGGPFWRRGSWQVLRLAFVSLSSSLLAFGCLSAWFMVGVHSTVDQRNASVICIFYVKMKLANSWLHIARWCGWWFDCQALCRLCGTACWHDVWMGLFWEM